MTRECPQHDRESIANSKIKERQRFRVECMNNIIMASILALADRHTHNLNIRVYYTFDDIVCNGCVNCAGTKIEHTTHYMSANTFRKITSLHVKCTRNSHHQDMGRAGNTHSEHAARRHSDSKYSHEPTNRHTTNSQNYDNFFLVFCIFNFQTKIKLTKMKRI